MVGVKPKEPNEHGGRNNMDLSDNISDDLPASQTGT